MHLCSKTKVQLICTFVFAYAKRRFFHDAAHLLNFILNKANSYDTEAAFLDLKTFDFLSYRQVWHAFSKQSVNFFLLLRLISLGIYQD